MTATEHYAELQKLGVSFIGRFSTATRGVLLLPAAIDKEPVSEEHLSEFFRLLGAHTYEPQKVLFGLPLTVTNGKPTSKVTEPLARFLTELSNQVTVRCLVSIGPDAYSTYAAPKARGSYELAHGRVVYSPVLAFKPILVLPDVRWLNYDAPATRFNREQLAQVRKLRAQLAKGRLLEQLGKLLCS